MCRRCSGELRWPGPITEELWEWVPTRSCINTLRTLTLTDFPGGNMPANAGALRNAGLRVRKIPCRRGWQFTPVFLSGESHGQRSLAGYILPMGSQRVGCDWVTNTFTFHICDKELIFKVYKKLLQLNLRKRQAMQEYFKRQKI